MGEKSAPHTYLVGNEYYLVFLLQPAQSPAVVGAVWNQGGEKASSSIHYQGQGRGERFPLFYYLLFCFWSLIQIKEVNLGTSSMSSAAVALKCWDHKWQEEGKPSKQFSDLNQALPLNYKDLRESGIKHPAPMLTPG